MASATIEDQREKVGFWFSEYQSKGIKTDVLLQSIHHSTQSEYQQIDVIETAFGKTLVTDGKTQSAECDEFIYHETLVQPSLFLRGMIASKDNTNGEASVSPKKVLIGGGGELATAREVLRHTSVERCVMVDLDEEVVNVSKQHLPTWGNNVAEDERFELVIGDAYAYINNTEEKFDLIIMDISDPIEAGPGIALYTQEFYQIALTKLSQNGVFVTQAGNANVLLTHDGLNESSFPSIANTLDSVFDCTIPYSVSIPSFQTTWAFVLAFNVDDISGHSSSEIINYVKNVPEEVVDKRIEACINDGVNVLKHYDGCTHRHMFSLVKSMRTKLAMDKRIMTKANPIFMF